MHAAFIIEPQTKNASSHGAIWWKESPFALTKLDLKSLFHAAKLVPLNTSTPLEWQFAPFAFSTYPFGSFCSHAQPFFTLLIYHPATTTSTFLPSPFETISSSISGLQESSASPKKSQRPLASAIPRLRALAPPRFFCEMIFMRVSNDANRSQISSDPSVEPSLTQIISTFCNVCAQHESSICARYVWAL